MLSTSSTLDALLKEATSNPYHPSKLPRIAVLATSAKELLYSNAAGYAQLPSSPSLLPTAEKLTPESQFTMWSSTKLITVIAALQLVEQGKISLDDDATKYVPGLREVQLLKEFDGEGKPVLEENKITITVLMLVNHTAGFTYEFNGPLFVKYQEYKDFSTVYGEGNSEKNVTEMPLMFEPGSRWHYGMNNDWLGFIVEAVSGLKLGEYFQKNIFDPLGITDISYKTPSNRINQVYYEPGSTKSYTTGLEQVMGDTNLGGAGLFGSPSSYIKILQTLLPAYSGPALLSSATVAKMFEPTLTSDIQLEDVAAGTMVQDPYSFLEGKPATGNNFGLGGSLGGRVLPSGRSKGSLTWAGAAGTFWVVDKDNDLAFVVWTEMWPFGPKQFYEVWAKVEPELYKGIGVEPPVA